MSSKPTKYITILMSVSNIIVLLYILRDNLISMSIPSTTVQPQAGTWITRDRTEQRSMPLMQAMYSNKYYLRLTRLTLSITVALTVPIELIS